MLLCNAVCSFLPERPERIQDPLHLLDCFHDLLSRPDDLRLYEIVRDDSVKEEVRKCQESSHIDLKFSETRDISKFLLERPKIASGLFQAPGCFPDR